MSRIIINNSNNIYIDDYKSIIHISDTEIIIKCNKRVICVTGNNLVIESFDINGIHICGSINNINWQK